MSRLTCRMRSSRSAMLIPSSAEPIPGPVGCLGGGEVGAKHSPSRG
jgi:hypothetical protein